MWAADVRLEHWEEKSKEMTFAANEDHGPQAVEQESVRLSYLIKLGKDPTHRRTHTRLTALASLDSHGGRQRGLAQPT